MGVAEGVQPDPPQRVLIDRLACLRHWVGEWAGEPLRVPVRAVRVAEQESGVPQDVQTSRPRFAR